jgi:LemA protein
MEAEGLITAEQAALLRESLGRPDAGGTAEPPSEPRPLGRPRDRQRRWLVLALLLSLIVAFIVALELGPDRTAGVQDVAQSLNQAGELGQMNRSLSFFFAVALILIVPIGLAVLLHNSLVGKEERVLEAWAQAESNFQRRSDLIPALVETVGRYVRHEAETLGAVTGARAQTAAALSGALDELTRAERDAAEILRRGGAEITGDDTALSRLQAAEAAFQGGLGRLLAVVEAYPELKASDQFLELQAQLEGTENRINVARLRFNEAVGDYNGTLRMMPWNLVARLGSFQRKAYFQAEAEARQAPELKFQ